MNTENLNTETLNSEENIIAGTDGGQHVADQPLTTTIAELAAPDLLSDSIDRRIVKVRPMSTPVDQISRCAASRPCRSMKVEYATVDVRPGELELKTDCGGTLETEGDVSTMDIVVDQPLDVTDTLFVPMKDGNESIVLYVSAKREAKGRYSVVVVNPQTSSGGLGGGGKFIPNLPSGTRVVRMGRAAAELDVQTGQFSALPKRASNNCQIFKMQVEQSTLMKIARKELGWNFSDQEEAAIIDMRLGMEKSFIFGRGLKFFDPAKNQDVYLTGGIWHQAGADHQFPLTNPGHADLVELCSKAFVGCNGSKRKILIAGTKLLEALSNIQYSKVVSAGETVVKWGIEFREIRSNFGTLYVVHSEIFDQCGYEDNGFILDPEYVTKYVHIPFNCETLDLRKSGQRNTDAVVLTEASCLVLRYPKSHVRVVGVRS